jgi:hypothetical protein
MYGMKREAEHHESTLATVGNNGALGAAQISWCMNGDKWS